MSRGQAELIVPNTMNKLHDNLYKRQQARVVGSGVKAQELDRNHHSQADSCSFFSKCFKDGFGGASEATMVDVVHDGVLEDSVVLVCGKPTVLGELKHDEARDGVSHHIGPPATSIHISLDEGRIVVDQVK